MTEGSSWGGGYALEENPSAQHVVCVMGRGGGQILCMIQNRLHLSLLPAVNTTKHLLYFSPHMSSSVKVLKMILFVITVV